MAWKGNGLRPCRLGTQPKGIGDATYPDPLKATNERVPPRHSAERHWRHWQHATLRRCRSPCRLGTQPKGIGDHHGFVRSAIWIWTCAA